jgi:hypothetical protein
MTGSQGYQVLVLNMIITTMWLSHNNQGIQGWIPTLDKNFPNPKRSKIKGWGVGINLSTAHKQY